MSFCKSVLTVMFIAAVSCGVSVAGVSDALKIDFNSTSQDSGPHPQEDYQSYDAAHEIPADFVTRSYDAFGTVVSLTPLWPDSEDEALSMQMIDRTADWDDSWLGEKVDLLTDWIGVDTRTQNGGNGDFNFEGGQGSPTRIQLKLEDLPAGTYDWVSYHHDTEMIHTEFFVEMSTDGGSVFDVVNNSAGEPIHKMTATSTNDPNRPNPPLPPDVPTQNGEDIEDPILLPSTILTSFEIGSEDFIIQFTPLSATAVHTQLVGINGFELYRRDTPSLECDFNTDEACTVEDIDLLLYDGLVSGDLKYDLDGSGAVDAADVTEWLGIAGEVNIGVDYVEGDTDLDGDVDAEDLNNLGISWQSTTATSWGEGDFDGDGDVDSVNLNSIGVNWQHGVASPAAVVPEPSCIGLLAVGVILMFARRRRG